MAPRRGPLAANAPGEDTESGREGRERREGVESLRVLSGGILGMMVAMGIGRFAYTPILPLMQRDLGLSHGTAGEIASLNYMGYLAGAVACSLFPGILRSGAVNASALLASLATTALMASFASRIPWGLLRLVSGAASAILFVVISVEVAEALAKRGRSRWTGALYGGIGLGMAASGTAVPLLDRWDGWRGAWLGMAALGVLLAAAGVLLGRTRGREGLHLADARRAVPGRLGKIRLLAAAYFFEGLGYVVSATFIVTMFARTPGLEHFAPWSWVAVGLAAAPSTLLWQQAGRRIGTRKALLLAYALQATGIVASIRATGAASAVLSSVLFGGTILGIVTLVMAEGVRRAETEGRRAAGILTACFGLGQVLGPPLAGKIADRTGGFALPLLLAALSVAVGAALVAADREYPARRGSDAGWDEGG
jgi:predicted MFS family arabinose efflux permease